MVLLLLHHMASCSKTELLQLVVMHLSAQSILQLLVSFMGLLPTPSTLPRAAEDGDGGKCHIKAVSRAKTSYLSRPLSTHQCALYA